jgi:hypothetical protein
MNSIAQFEDRASRSRSKHEGESSSSLCDRLSRTRDFSQRQLPTDQDYAVSTREYQTDQSSLKPAPAAAGPVLDKRQKQRQKQKQPHRFAGIDRVTPYQRQEGVPEPLKEIAWKAQVRLTKRYARLAAAGKDQRKIITAVGRELLGFIWAIGIQAEAASKLQMAA